jgi:S-formylglutathione hydrolase
MIPGMTAHRLDSSVELHDLASGHVSETVPYAVITPPGYHESGPLALCLVLMGGGGSRQSLVDCRPLFDSWWSDGLLPPMVLATPSAGMSYYLDDPDSGVRWERFLADDFLPHLRATCNVAADRSSTAITGISMGGYGALKTAFAHPDTFGTVAAMQPMLEPGLRDADIGARNRLHHASGGPPALVGPGRDPLVFEANNPANRARANARRIRDGGLAIYIEAGDEDFINAHDGAEFLHRVLWDLDISHEYRLIRGGDHGGPTFVPRMRATFAWVGSVVTALRAAATSEPTADELAVSAWIQNGRTGNPPAAAPSSKAFIRILRAQFEPIRERAAACDPSTNRRYGVLPGARAVGI